MEQHVTTNDGDTFLDIILNDDERLDVEFQERPNTKIVMYLNIDGVTKVRVLAHEHQIMVKRAKGEYREA